MNIGMETELIEFKESTGELKEGIISLASMLNKNGRGVLYFGVKNDGEIVGQQIGDRTMREISQGIENLSPIRIKDIIMGSKCKKHINLCHICRNRLRKCLKRIWFLNCQGLQCQKFSISDFLNQVYPEVMQQGLSF